MKRRNVVTSAALTAICLVLVIPIVIYSFPFIVGADSSYTVMSGSMSPALSPGDLVIVKGEDHIYIGDIVTVKSGEFTFTHRVYEKLEGDRFVLKGDANEDPDTGFVQISQIIGKVVMVFPFSHLYTPYGFALALFAPAGIIIGNQLYIIYQHTKRKNKRETMRFRRKSQRSAMLGTGTMLLALILTVSTTRIIAPQFIGGSSSYFSDTEWAKGSFRAAGIWEVSVQIEIAPDIEPDIGLNIEPDIKPNVLNLGSKGTWIMVHIQSEYDANKIDVNTVRLEGVLADGDEWKIEDGRLMVKFDRESVISNMEVIGDYVTLTVSGLFLDGVRFTGEDTIKVVNNEV